MWFSAESTEALMQYFHCRRKIGDEIVSVAVTPNGYADAVFGDKFVMPEERKLPFSGFLDVLEEHKDKDKETSGIFYVQKQNSNFTEEFESLMSDADEHIDWATEAFGTNRNLIK